MGNTIVHLEIGDIISRPRRSGNPLSLHFGLICKITDEELEVIHWTPRKGIHKSNLDKFVTNGTLCVYDERTELSKEEILERVNDWYEHRNERNKEFGHVFAHNCESFVRFLKGLHDNSPHRTSAVSVGIIVSTISALLAFGYGTYHSFWNTYRLLIEPACRVAEGLQSNVVDIYLPVVTQQKRKLRREDGINNWTQCQ